MYYAVIENGNVVNLIWLYGGNDGDFPAAVALGDRPVAIGDTYEGGVFRRDGQLILTPLEEAQGLIAELDGAIVDLEYQAALKELGLT